MLDGSRASCAAASVGVPCTGRTQPLPQTRACWRRSVLLWSLSILQDIVAAIRMVVGGIVTCVPVFIQLCLAWNRERVALQLRAPPIDE